MSGVGETIASMLSRLDLDRYAGVFEEEAITHTALLASIGELLQDNLEELGLDAVAIAAVVEDLFPTEVNGRALPANPESAPQHSVAGPSIRGPQPELQVTQEEIEAAEAEAQWLLNPMSLLDLSATKDKLMQLHAEAIKFQRNGQHANARAVYTRALAMEAPNKRSSASLYYNRAACQRALGQLALALRDAQKAAELEPDNALAWWRAADVAISLGNWVDAQEAVAAGLKSEPLSQPLLQLKLQLANFDQPS